MTAVIKQLDPTTQESTYRSVGDSIKATDKNRVGGYLVRYTSADDPDLHGEYFDKSTYFWEVERPIKGIPVMIDHAFDSKFKGLPVGIVDFVNDDEVGIWIEAKLNEREQYLEYLQHMRAKGVIDVDDKKLPRLAANIAKAVDLFFATNQVHWSSGAHPQLVEVSDNGHIKSWAFIEATGVMHPAEEDGTEVKAVKSAFALLDEILNSESTATEAIEPNQEATELDADNSNPIDNLPNENGNKTMNLEEMLALLKQLEEAMTAFGTDSGAPEEEAVAMADEVVDEVRAIDEEEMKGITPEALASKAFDILNQKLEERRVKAAALKNAFDAKAQEARIRNAHSAPQTTGGDQRTPRVSVGENLKYAHLTADQMAAGYLLIESQYPKSAQGRIAANQLVSDEYTRHMVNKALQETKSPEKFGDIRDYYAVKSAIPYKNDDFDASNISGQGQDWVGTFYGTRLWEKARDETKVFSEMQSRGMFVQEIPQGHASVVIPTEGADPVAYSTPQANDLDATNRPEVTANIGYFGTGSKTLSAAQIKIAAAATDELVEDSVIPILPQMTGQMQIKATETIDQAFINGDTDGTASTNINLIDGTPGTGINRPYYLAVDGLRKYPLVTNTAYARTAGGSFTIDDFRATLKLMSSAVRDRINELFFLIDSDTHNAALALPEIQTDDVRRTNATITSGRLLNIFGVDVLTSGFLATSNTAGKISGTPNNNTLGQILLVYPRFWAFGWKRNVRLDTEYSALSGTTVAVASMRFGLVARGADASAETYRVGIA